MVTAKKGNRGIQIIALILVAVLLLSGIGIGLWIAFAPKDETPAPITQSGFSTLVGKFTDREIKDESAAILAVKDVSKELGFTNAAEELSVKTTNTVDNLTYYRLQQNYQGIPVYGSTFVVVSDENGEAQGLTGNATDIDTDISLKPTVTQEQIEASIRAYVGEDVEISVPELSDDMLVIYNFDDAESTVLAYEIQPTVNREPHQIVLDATTGNLIESHTLIYTDTQIGTGYANDNKKYEFNTFLEDNGIYYLFDSERQIKICQATPNESKVGHYCINNSTEWNDTSAVTAMVLSSSVYNFYYELFDRHGFNNKNSLLHVFYDATFDGNVIAQSGVSDLTFHYISFSSNYLKPQTFGHEYTHSVERSIIGGINGMAYKGESGAIKEAYSDIFGELFEDWFYDHTLGGEFKCDWVANRSIKNPHDSKNPTTYQTDKYWKTTTPSYGLNLKSTNDNGNVHNNSTVISHAAYLMTLNSGKGQSLSMLELAELWYHTLHLLPKNCTFYDLRKSIEAVATVLDLSSEQHKRICAAFDAVGISTSTWGIDTSIEVVDLNNSPYSNCTIIIKDKNWCGKTREFVSPNSIIQWPDDLIGEYEITIKDNVNSANQTKKSVIISKHSINNENILIQLQGTHSTIEELINTRLVKKDIPSEFENKEAIGFLQIDKTEYWPSELTLSSQGKTSDGRIWKKYYYERIHYGIKEGSYLIHVQDRIGYNGEMYIMYAKASDSVLGGKCDEIYRKATVGKQFGIISTLECTSGSASDIMDNALKSTSGYCHITGESNPDDFLYWDASKKQILTSTEWRNIIHYDERFKWNNDDTLPQSVAEALEEGFKKLPIGDSKYHQLYDNLLEYTQWFCIKCAHADGREAIYTVIQPEQSKYSVLSNPSITKLLKLKYYPDVGPTYNYSPNDSYEISWLDSLGSALIGTTYSKISFNSIAHYYFDMLPYYWWGNAPDDYTHTHTFGDWTITKEATETEKGEKTRTCSSCGEKEIEEIPMLNHPHSYTTTTQDTTCTVPGWTKQECECGDVIETPIPVIPHNYVDGECTMCGTPDPSISDNPTPTQCPTPVIQTESDQTITVGDDFTVAWTSVGENVEYYMYVLKDGEAEPGTPVWSDWSTDTAVTIDGDLFPTAGRYMIHMYARYIDTIGTQSEATAIYVNVTEAEEDVQGSVGLEYTLNSDGTGYIVTGIGTCTDTDIVIPSMHEGLPVTSIGAAAFYDCTSLTSVTIPDSVTSIGEGAFDSCTSLTSVTIPDSVTSIGDWAFFGCTSLTSVTIPDSVTIIGDYAFYVCAGITNITIPDGVTIIEAGAFGGCSSLTHITIPNNVISIGYEAFIGCTSLTSIIIPDRVTNIGEDAFYSCDSLTNITIPNSVKNIGDSAFQWCKNLNTVYYGGTAEDWVNISIGSNNSELSNATIIFNEEDSKPDNNQIPSDALEYNGHYYYVFSLSDITSWNAAKEYCESLGGYLATISDKAENDAIYTQMIQQGYKSAYLGLSDAETEKTWKWITGEPLLYTNWHSGEPNSESKSEDYAMFYYKYSDGTWNDGDFGSGTVSGGRAFVCEWGDPNPTQCPTPVINTANEQTITAGSDFTVSWSSLGTNVEYYMYVLKDGEADPGTPVWSAWSTDTSVTIDGDLFPTTGRYMIHMYARYIDTIGTQSEATAIYVNVTEAEEDVQGSVGLEYALNSDGTGYIVTGIGTCTDTDIVIPSMHEGLPVTSIGDYAFYDCKSLSSVIIPDSVTTIGEGVFLWCDSLSNVTISNNVTAINNNTFSGCISLTSIIIPDSVTFIGESTFAHCTSLKNVTLGNGIISISGWAFQYCELLTNINFPNSLESIGRYAFLQCNSLKNISIPNKIKSIEEGSFHWCESLETITIGSGITSIENYAFLLSDNLSTVYYSGNDSEWKKILIGDQNTSLTSATRYYYSETTPTTDGNYWHYVDGVPTVWESNGEDANTLLQGSCGDDINWTLYENGHLEILGSGETYTYDIAPWNDYSELITSVYIEPGITNLFEEMFADCTQLKHIEIPYGVIEIGDAAFAGCSSIKNINLPDSITKIGMGAFAVCTNLEQITLSKNLEFIGTLAFLYCTALTEIHLPASLADIGEYENSGFLTYCTSLEQITIDESNPYFYVEDNCLISNDGTLYAVCKNSAIPTDGSIKELAEFLFMGNDFTEFIIPEGVETIGEQCFNGCANLKNISIPNTIKVIGYEPFCDCISFSIYYDGTIDEWREIIGHDNISENGSYTIYCTDGKITKKENQIEFE